MSGIGGWAVVAQDGATVDDAAEVPEVIGHCGTLPALADFEVRQTVHVHTSFFSCAGCAQVQRRILVMASANGSLLAVS